MTRDQSPARELLDGLIEQFRQTDDLIAPLVQRHEVDDLVLLGAWVEALLLIPKSAVPKDLKPAFEFGQTLLGQALKMLLPFLQMDDGTLDLLQTGENQPEVFNTLLWLSAAVPFLEEGELRQTIVGYIEETIDDFSMHPDRFDELGDLPEIVESALERGEIMGDDNLFERFTLAAVKMCHSERRPTPRTELDASLASAKRLAARSL